MAHYDNTPFWIPAGTNKDDLECSIQLQVGGTLDPRLLWLSELAMRDWMTASDKTEASELWFQSTRGLYEFSPAFTSEGVKNQSWAAKLVYYSHYASSSLRYLEMCGHLEYVLFWKLLTAF